jgi:predicted DNA-binding transcriptional regulator YafY
VNAIERALAILLVLTRRRVSPATELARRFGVSVRTIYRDIDRLLALGIPVEAERGAEGGFRLPPDYVPPPIAINRVEATALLVALALMRGLRATPLKGDLDTAEAKLLAILPRSARDILANGSRFVGIEPASDDIFHGERPGEPPTDQQATVDRFLDGILAQSRVELVHHNPYRGSDKAHEIEPYGILWDRNRWYLVGRSLGAGEIRMWRADRVLSISVTGMRFRPPADFDIRTMLGRRWLEMAMRSWDRGGAGTRIRVTANAAARLRRDWYYQHAAFTSDGDSRFVMTIPDTEPANILPLARWLGSEAEILSPESLRTALRRELDALRQVYA